MTTRLLTELIKTPNDLDYVEHFQALAKVNLEMRNEGPTTERLLRKAILEMDLGNYAAGLRASQDAITVEPARPEAHYQEGVAYVLSAFVKAGALPLAPGSHDIPRDSVSDLLGHALASFEETVRRNPGDEEAAEDLAAIRRFLAAHKGEEALLAALRNYVL